MSTLVTIAGVSYAFPQTGDQAWGDAVTAWAIAVSSKMLQTSGGNFVLTSEVDFGATWGLKAAYLKSRTANPSATGLARLGVTDTLAWRNNANSADLALGIDGSDRLTFAGVPVLSAAGGILGVAAGGTGLTSFTAGDTIYASGATTLAKRAIGSANTVSVSNGSIPAWALLVNANIDPAAAIAYSKLALSGSIVNADISAAAAIAYSKLALSGSIVNADISAAAAIAYSKLALTGAIQNADLAAAVSIAKGGTGQTTASAAFGALSPLTTKGDVLGFDTGNNRVPVGSDGTVLTADSSQALGLKWATAATAPDSSEFYTNGSLAASVATNALTIALKDKSGSDPSAGSKVQIAFRNATATNGTYNYRAVSAALSITIPDATGLGLTTGVTSYLYLYAIDNAGTVELAVSPSSYWDEASLHTTVAVSGGSSLTSLYSTTARSNVPIRRIGRIAVNLAASNHWSNSPTEIASIPFLARRQFVLGTAQTASISTASTSYVGSGSLGLNTPTITFTPERTGRYRIGFVGMINNSIGGDRTYIKLNATAGSPTIVFNQVATAEPGAGAEFPAYTYILADLVAGTSYTFEINMKVSGGTGALRNDIPDSGSAIWAEEL